MKGTDCTPEQLKAAELFILQRAHRDHSPNTVTLAFDELVRLVAWYGAMRYEAGQKGFGTLEVPGEMVTNPARCENCRREPALFSVTAAWGKTIRIGEACAEQFRALGNEVTPL